MCYEGTPPLSTSTEWLWINHAPVRGVASNGSYIYFATRMHKRSSSVQLRVKHFK